MQNRLPSCPKKMFVTRHQRRFRREGSGASAGLLEEDEVSRWNGSQTPAPLCTEVRQRWSRRGSQFCGRARLCRSLSGPAVGPLRGQSLADLSDRDSRGICSGMTSSWTECENVSVFLQSKQKHTTRCLGIPCISGHHLRHLALLTHPPAARRDAVFVGCWRGRPAY